jgi:site-specific recombinase XerD
VVPPSLAENPVAVYLRRLSAGSRGSIRSSLRQVLDVLGASDVDLLSFPWERLRYAETSAIRSALAERYAPATGNRALSAVRGVLKEAWRLGLMSNEAMARATDLPPIRGSRLPAGRYVTSGEQRALFEACAADRTPAGRRDAAVLGLGFGAGLRRAEIASLTVAAWDPETGRVKVIGKGGKQRAVPLSAGARHALADWLAVAGADDPTVPLLRAVNRAGTVATTGISGQAILALLAKRATEAGVPPLRPHDLRRSFVSDHLDAGNDLAVVQQLAGHSSPTTTSRYDRRGERARDDAAARLSTPYVSPLAAR